MTRHTPGEEAGTCWLGDPASQDPAVVGEAVACLGRLTGREPVPPAFCLAAPPLDVCADGSLAAGSVSLARMYARLASVAGRPDPPVVVRSALIGRARPVASWVAEPWTFWNVSGLEAVRTAVIECAAPYVSDRARGYRIARAADADVRLVIVIQQFIAARACSRVSVGPGGDEVLIRSCWGLCDVAADGVWDTVIVRRADLSVLRRTIADKRQMAVAGDGGVVHADVPAFQRLARSLDVAQARRLAELAVRIEPEAGGPVEAEVAWTGSQMHLLWCEPGQARGDTASLARN